MPRYWEYPHISMEDTYVLEVMHFIAKNHSTTVSFSSTELGHAGKHKWGIPI